MKQYKVLKFNCQWEEIPAEQNPWYTRQAEKEMSIPPEERKAEPYCLLVCCEGMRVQDSMSGYSYAVYDISETFEMIMHLGSFWMMDIAEGFAKYWAETRNRILAGAVNFQADELLIEGEHNKELLISKINGKLHLQILPKNYKQQWALLSPQQAVKLVNYIGVMFNMHCSDMEGLDIKK